MIRGKEFKESLRVAAASMGLPLKSSIESSSCGFSSILSVPLGAPITSKLIRIVFSPPTNGLPSFFVTPVIETLVA